MWIVLCGDRLDGVAGAAIIVRAARMRDTPCKVGGVFRVDEMSVLSTVLAGEQNAMLFLVGVSPDGIPGLGTLLPQVALRNVVAYWACHGTVAEDALDLVRKHARVMDIVGGSQSCVAELVQKRLLPNDPVARMIAAITADMEFGVRKDERGGKLQELLASGIDPKQMIEVLSKGAFWTDEWETARERYVARRSAWHEELMNHLTIKQCGSQRFGFGLAPQGLPADDATGHILEKHDGVDVAVAVCKDARVVFRLREGVGLDAQGIASAFGGRGCKVDGFGVVDGYKSVTWENWDDVLFAMERKLKGLLEPAS